MTKLIVAALIASCTFGPTARSARADVPATVNLPGAPAILTRLFDSPSAQPEWFTAAFLEQVPIEQVNAALTSVKKQFGTLKSVDGSGLNYEAHLQRGSVHISLVINHAGLIAALAIQP